MKTIYKFYAILAILAISLSSYAQSNTFKVLSYNVYWGMRKDTTENKSQFAEWIKKQNADVVALQEVNGFTQKKLEAFAKSYGHPYAILVKEPEPDGSVSFPVALTSKYPIVNVQRVVDNLIHGLIVAEVEGYHYMVTHFHPFSAERRGQEIDLVLASAKAKAPQGKWILMGDLNSVSPLDKSEYDNNLVRNHIREAIKNQKKPAMDELVNRNLINNELDYSVQQKVLDAGYVDALKVFYSKFIPSAPTKVFYDQSNFPLRYDYFYVSENIKKDLVKCELIKDELTDNLSDHYPVIAIIKK